MIDIFVTIVTIIAGIICLFVNVYIMAIYSHKEDNILRPIYIIGKILIVFTLFQIQFQPLFMIYDTSNARVAGPDLNMGWYIIYFSIIGNIAVIKPLITSFYESDSDDPCWKRFLWVIAEFIISMLVFGVLLGIGWILLGSVDYPIELKKQDFAYNFQAFNNTIIIEDIVANTSSSSTSFSAQITVPCFLLGLFCLLGYPILICCGTCGMTALPLGMILQFVHRPQYRRTNDARKIKKQLQQQTVRLIKQADEVKRSINRFQYVDGWFAKRKQNNQVEQKLTQLEKTLQKHRDLHQLFKLQVNIKEVNPIVYICKLLLGILIFIGSLILWLQVLLSQLVYKQKGTIFLDYVLISLTYYNANFVCIALLMLIVIFLVCSMIKGAIFLSSNLPKITFHPILPGKTWLNSFLFHLTLCLFGSASILHLLLNSFPQYLRGGQIALIMGGVMQGLMVIGIFIRNKVFTYAFVIMYFLGGLYVLIRMFCFVQFRTDLAKAIQQKRIKLFGEENKEKPMMIEMTEMNLGDKNKNTPEKDNSKRKKTTPLKSSNKKKKVKITAI